METVYPSWMVTNTQRWACTLRHVHVSVPKGSDTSIMQQPLEGKRFSRRVSCPINWWPQTNTQTPKLCADAEAAIFRINENDSRLEECDWGAELLLRLDWPQETQRQKEQCKADNLGRCHLTKTPPLLYIWNNAGRETEQQLNGKRDTGSYCEEQHHLWLLAWKQQIRNTVISKCGKVDLTTLKLLSSINDITPSPIKGSCTRSQNMWNQRTIIFPL